MIPTTCAGDVTTYSSTVPNVSLFAPDYIAAAQLAREPQLEHAGAQQPLPAVERRDVFAEPQSAESDRSELRPRSRASRCRAKNRPVFVNPTSIFPTTGAILSRDARITQSFAQVTDYLSDLQSHSTQLTLRRRRRSRSTRRSSGARRTSGRRSSTRRAASAAATTAGDPYLTQWARGDRDARHQITYNVGYTFHQAVSVTAFGRFQSGNPFTPIGLRRRERRRLQQRSRVHLQSGDDDGLRLSRRACRICSANAPSSVRDCLKKQLGTIAGKNSCEGPWSTSLSLRIALVSQALKIPDRATISLGIANPLTGIDALVHGSNNLHGWGAPSFVDPTLLYVRGFDPTTQTLHLRRQSALRREPSGERAQPRADAAHARRAVRRRSGARASGSLPAPAHAAASGKGNKMSEQQIKQRCTSAAIRIRSSRCCGRRIRSA